MQAVWHCMQSFWHCMQAFWHCMQAFWHCMQAFWHCMQAFWQTLLVSQQLHKRCATCLLSPLAYAISLCNYLNVSNPQQASFLFYLLVTYKWDVVQEPSIGLTLLLLACDIQMACCTGEGVSGAVRCTWCCRGFRHLSQHHC